VQTFPIIAADPEAVLLWGLVISIGIDLGLTAEGSHFAVHAVDDLSAIESLLAPRPS
jgi:hypothetical protein